MLPLTPMMEVPVDAKHVTSRALLYRLLAGAFVYPDVEAEAALCSGEFLTTLKGAARALGNADLVESIEHLRGAIFATGAADLSLAAEHVTLFTRNVPCSPYASRYLVRDVMARPRVLEEVNRVYHAFGVQVDRDRPDLPDHIGAELEFLGYLLAKELHALEQGWQEQAQICRDARATLLREHLLLWVPVFYERLNDHARLPFYPAVTGVALALLQDDAGALGVTVGSVAETRDAQRGESVEGDEHGSSFDCGVVSRSPATGLRAG
jgi:DMSO reductase family type II enzyme chaperone